MRKFIPRADRLLVRPIKPEQKKGGLQDPEIQREKPLEGEVLAVGRDISKSRVRLGGGGTVVHRPGGFEVGDIVCWRKYAGVEKTINGEELLILQASDVDGWMVEEA